MKIQPLLYNTRDLIFSLILSAGLLMSLVPDDQGCNCYSPVDMALDTDMGHIYVAGFDSRRITCIDQKDGKVLAEVDLRARPKAVAVAGNIVFAVCSDPEGEMYFNDALYCFQQWQSCNGCHPDHARTDGLNWDLLNDGMGNPKNCKSMLFAHARPPAKFLGYTDPPGSLEDRPIPA